MEQQIKIRCKNNKKSVNIRIGSTLSEIFSQLGLEMEYGPISAKVNNKVEGMHYRVYKPKDIEFLDMHSASGIRAYTRSVFFVLCKAAHDLWKNCTVIIDIPISNGYYVNLKLGREVTPDDVNELRQRMQQLIDARLPIHRFESTTEEAIEMFRQGGSMSKVKLLENSGRLYTTYYDLDGYKDYYYGTLLTNTKQIYLLTGVLF